jgi:hypothetical protein
MSVEVNIKGAPVRLVDTSQLAIFYNKTKELNDWIIQKFFPNKVGFNDDRVELGKLETSTPIAPLVAPSVQGRVMLENARYDVEFVEPAYLKPSAMITPSNVTNLALLGTLQEAGIIENINNMTDQEKLRVAQVTKFLRNRRSIVNFNILMSRDVLLKGKVTFQSKDFPEITVDFGRSAAMEFAPTIPWNQDGATPVTDIESMLKTMSDEGGVSPSVALMSSKVFNALTSNKQFEDKFNFKTEKGVDVRNPFNATFDRGNAPKMRGELDGIEFWTWDETFKNDKGVVERYIQQGGFHLIADVSGFQCQCALQNFDVLGEPLEAYDYIVESKDPPGMKLITESSPLMVPSMVNGVIGGEDFVV